MRIEVKTIIPFFWENEEEMFNAESTHRRHCSNLSPQSRVQIGSLRRKWEKSCENAGRISFNWRTLELGIYGNSVSTLHLLEQRTLGFGKGSSVQVLVMSLSFGSVGIGGKDFGLGYTWVQIFSSEHTLATWLVVLVSCLWKATQHLVKQVDHFELVLWL